MKTTGKAALVFSMSVLFLVSGCGSDSEEVEKAARYKIAEEKAYCAIDKMSTEAKKELANRRLHSMMTLEVLRRAPQIDLGEWDVALPLVQSCIDAESDKEGVLAGLSASIVVSQMYKDAEYQELYSSMEGKYRKYYEKVLAEEKNAAEAIEKATMTKEQWLFKQSSK